MANIFTPTGREPTFISIKEVRDSTEKSGIMALWDKDIGVLISKSEKSINKYMGRTLDVTDWTTEEISDLKIATLYVIEQLFENGDTINPANTAGWDIVEEKTGDRSVKYSESKSSKDNDKLLGIPDVAKSILDKYRRLFYKQVI